MKERYFPPIPDGRWSTGIAIGGRWVCLIQDTHLDREADAEEVLFALGIKPTQTNLDYYFPIRGGRRCPTLELLECTKLQNPESREEMLKRWGGV